MRAPSRRSLLPLTAVLALLVLAGAVALARGEGIWPGGPSGAGPAASPAAAAPDGAAPARPGTGAGAGATGRPVPAGPATGRGVVATTDALLLWTGRSGRSPNGGASRPPLAGAPAPVQLDLRVGGDPGGGVAVVTLRNPAAAPVPVSGTLQVLASGPGAPVVVRQPVRRTIAAGQAATVRLAFRLATPGVYRVRALLVPS